MNFVGPDFRPHASEQKDRFNDLAVKAGFYDFKKIRPVGRPRQKIKSDNFDRSKVKKKKSRDQKGERDVKSKTSK